ncbi:MAG TPA: hypothetical protein VJ508_12035, partial [Saprospiraceae bacterium]|nr:hypothetical protein [Saprospiraceae bacterium]
ASQATFTATFQNCIFDGYMNGLNNINNTILVDHCLFLRTNGEAFIDLLTPSVTNSIFMNYTSVANAGTTGGTFFNNIARLAATLPPAGNSGSGNLSSTNPNFVTYTLDAFYSTSHDYHLQAGSPAIGTASDATDIGIHGGTSKFDETGEALIAPVMRDMQVINTTVLPNATLNVNISASKPNDN